MDSYTSTIISAEKATLQEDGSLFLDVAFTIHKDGEIVDTKRLGFPIDTSADDIKAEIARYIANYAAEAQATIDNAEQNAELAAADETIADLLGDTVEPAINTPEA